MFANSGICIQTLKFGAMCTPNFNGYINMPQFETMQAQVESILKLISSVSQTFDIFQLVSFT